MMEPALSVLPNGMRLVTCRMPSVESVAMGVWVGVGGRHEEPALSGISHFIEHLLFKGTRTRSASAISRAIEGRGGDFNAFTQEDATCYYVRMAARQADAAFAILTDMIRHPRFAAADVVSEREVIRDEILMYRDQPAQVAEDLLGELLWADHPLGRPLAGTPATLDRIRRTDILAYRKATYVPSSTILAVAGKVDHARWLRRTERAFADWTGPRQAACRPVLPGVVQKRVGLVAKESEQAHLALGFRVFGRHDPRRHALKVMSVVLGENMSSRLFQVIREKHGLAYAIQSCTSHFADTGSLVITAGVDPDRIRRVVSLIGRELRRLRDTPVGGRELRRAKDYLTGQVRLGLESSGRQMNWAGEAVLAYDRFVAPDEVIGALEEVTAEQVRAEAAAAFRTPLASLALVAPGLKEEQTADYERLVDAALSGA
jgi:predicted Zn-dependent peptidase